MKQEIIFQRVEMLALFITATVLYFWLHFAWWLFATLLFSFDISMVGYFVNKRTGAILYNSGHALLLPLVIVLFSTIYGHAILLAFGLIWLAHIGLDRGLGYGLKMTSSFSETHLGKIGKI